MKKSRKIIIFSVIIFLMCTLFAKANAVEVNGEVENVENYSRAYQEYLKLSDEEKAKLEVIPRKYDVPLDSIYEDTIEVKEAPSLFNLFGLKAKTIVKSSYEDELPEYFNLQDVIEIPVKNQGDYGLCWAFASMRALETNLVLHGYGYYDFSELHLGYFTTGAIYEEKISLPDCGGNFEYLKTYCSNMFGPVLEEQVPYDYEYNYTIEQYDYLSNLDEKAYLVETIDFPTINKRFITYTEEEHMLFRNKVKKHIMENGSIYASINSEGIRNNTLYTTNSHSNHAISIIGWDDNYSKENFKNEKGQTPNEDGAYIALNSWGSNDLLYISYEDILVEMEMSGVVISTTDKQEDCTRIEFNDKNLYDAIKEIFKTQIIEFDDKTMTILTIKPDKNISKINLSNKNIVDVTGLAEFCEFMTIRELDLSNNKIAEIGNLPEAENINLANNEIEDISTLPNAYVINLSGNNIETIPNLRHLDKLSDLDLSNNQLKDLSYLPNIWKINLSGNNIETLPDLSRWYYLKILDLSNNNITDYSNLPVTIEELYLANNNIETIPDLTYLNRLSVLDLSGNNITDYSNLPNIWGIYLANNNIETIPDLTYLDNLYLLDLSYNNITDYSNLPNIGELNLSHNNIETIPDLSYLDDLYSLNLSHNNIETLSNLKNINGLYILDLSNNHITDISNLPNADEIYLGHNNIEILPDLSHLDNLETLDLNNNKITDIANVFKIPDLQTINLKNNNIETIPDSDIYNLLNIDLAYNHISEWPANFNAAISNQNIELNINLKVNNKNIIDLYNPVYKTYFMQHLNANIETQNCTIDYTNKQIIIEPKELGEGIATIKINGGIYSGTTYTINYVAKDSLEYEKIEISNMPNRVKYIENEAFDSEGLKVVGVINGQKYEISDYEIINGENLQIGQESVTVKYGENLEASVPIIICKEDDVVKIEFNDTNTFNSLKELFENSEKLKLGYDNPIYTCIEPYTMVLSKDKIENICDIMILHDDVEDISGLEKFPNLNKISLLNKTDKKIIEEYPEKVKLPKYIYQLLTLWDENYAIATIYYEVYYFKEDEQKTLLYSNNFGTRTEIELDYENEEAYILLDYEDIPPMTRDEMDSTEVVVLDNVRAFSIKFEGKITGPTYTGFYKCNPPIKLTVETNELEEIETDGKKYIEKINPSTTIESIKQLISTNGIIELFKGTEKITNELEKLATGMKFVISLGEEKVEYTVVVTGDLNGDGEMNDIDVLKLARYKAGLDNNLQDEYLQATNVYKDENLADDIDLLKLVRILVGLDTLNV